MYKATLYPGLVFHIYNRAHGSERMFTDHVNYKFFMDRYVKFIDPIAECISYCLMPNHFHILLRVREIKRVQTEMGLKEPDKLSDSQLNQLLVKRFGDFFNSYAKSFNKQQGRKGSLFMHSFKRKVVKDAVYLRKLIHYIHRNPIEAGLVESPEMWRYSSYSDIVFSKSRYNIKLDTDAIFAVFDSIEDFIRFHNQSSAFELLDNL